MEDGLDGWIQAFLDHLTATRSPHTVRSYGADLAQYAAVAEKSGELGLTSETMRRFLREFGKTPVTRARKLSTLRSFVRFLRRLGKVGTDPTDPDWLNAFLAHAALESGQGQGSASEDCVQLMTLHMAKGL